MSDKEILLDISNTYVTCSSSKNNSAAFTQHFKDIGHKHNSKKGEEYIKNNKVNVRGFGYNQKNTLWIELDRWLFLKHQTSSLYYLDVDGFNVFVECTTDMEHLREILKEQGFLKVKISQTTCLDLAIGHLKLGSHHKVIGKDILFFDKFEHVLKDLKKLAIAGRSSVGCKPLSEEYNSERIEKSSLSQYGSSAPSIYLMPKEIRLKMTKQDITFLIGYHGKRIEYLKNASGAIIKVIPIAKKLSIEQTKNPHRIEQEMALYGTLQQLHVALVLIEQHLILSQTICLRKCHHPKCQHEPCKLYF